MVVRNSRLLQQKGKNLIQSQPGSQLRRALREARPSQIHPPHLASLHDASSPRPPVAVPSQLIKVIHEGGERNVLHLVNTKLDSVINEVGSLNTDLEQTKKTVSELQTSLTNKSNRLLAVENKSLPELRNYIDEKIAELDEKLTLSEIHERKHNHLVYGIPSKPEENIHETVHDNIPQKEAMLIPVVNAHHLPSLNQGNPDSERQPHAIIIRFACMLDRDRLPCPRGR